jgi:hypothetical protein
MTPTALFITALLGEFVTLVGILVPLITSNRKTAESYQRTREEQERIAEGQRCLLRKAMLDIYYANYESKSIRQYAYQNFVLMYEAYKALNGNSFIDKIYDEVRSWEIIT